MDQRRRRAIALRDGLVDRLVRQGTVRSAAVEAALRAVPRERFVPELDLLEVYDDRPQLVKAGRWGPLSTISQPTMVAIMLEAADLAAGEQVLEIGTGTGYNAALLGTIVGPTGSVVSLDIEDDLVRFAASALDHLGLPHVEVHTADGRDGWPLRAPYDCVMATASVDAVPDPWRQQVADGGRLVVPLDPVRSLQVERRRGDVWIALPSSPATFIPLR